MRRRSHTSAMRQCPVPQSERPSNRFPIEHRRRTRSRAQPAYNSSPPRSPPLPLAWASAWTSLESGASPAASQNKPYIRYYYGLEETLSHSQLYLSPRPAFTGISSPLEKSRFVFFGVPFDRTSTYNPGSRFAPSALRDVSANMELYSIRSTLDLEKVPRPAAGY